jgi:hypothetical protein
MVPSQNQQFNSLCAFLAARRQELLRAWCLAVAADPEQTTARSLTRGQLYDHIPESARCL